MPDPRRAGCEPDDTFEVFAGSMGWHDATIHGIELRQYIEGTDGRLGPYSLITSLVRIGPDSIEMIYDEGYRGDDALRAAGRFLAGHLGVSGLITRSILALRSLK